MSEFSSHTQDTAGSSVIFLTRMEMLRKNTFEYHTYDQHFFETGEFRSKKAFNLLQVGTEAGNARMATAEKFLRLCLPLILPYVAGSERAKLVRLNSSEKIYNYCGM